LARAGVFLLLVLRAEVGRDFGTVAGFPFERDEDGRERAAAASRDLIF
jgi:hypothetical protein